MAPSSTARFSISASVRCENASTSVIAKMFPSTVLRSAGLGQASLRNRRSPVSGSCARLGTDLDKLVDRQDKAVAGPFGAPFDHDAFICSPAMPKSGLLQRLSAPADTVRRRIGRRPNDSQTYRAASRAICMRDLEPSLA